MQYEIIEVLESDPFAPVPERLVSILRAPENKGYRRKALLCTMRYSGWGLQHLADASECARERVRQIELQCHYEEHAAHSTLREDDDILRPKRTVQKRIRKFISQEDLDELRDLQSKCRMIRGNLPSTHPRRVAAEAFMDKVLEVNLKKGFSLYEIAKNLGVTTGAIRSRLVRYGKLVTQGSSDSLKPIKVDNRPSLVD